MPEQARFGRRMDGPTGRRHALRQRMSLEVSLFSVDQSRVALLADISHEGCCLHGTGLPRIGQDVLLTTGDVELFGRIVWKAGGNTGVKFDQAINEAEIEELRQILARQTGQEVVRPDTIPPEGRRQSSS
jgi:hypothetical protein